MSPSSALAVALLSFAGSDLGSIAVGTSTTPSPEPRRLWVVDIESEPEGADLFVNGKREGRTPVRLRVPSGVVLDVRLEKPHHHGLSDRFEVKAGGQRRYRLDVTAEEQHRREQRRQATEWAGIAVYWGATLSGATSVGGTIRLASFRARPWIWTALEGAAGYGANLLDDGRKGPFLYLGSRLGWFVYLDRHSHHEVRGSVGMGVSKVEMGDDLVEASVTLAPALLYNYRFESGWALGYALRGYFPLRAGVGRPGMVHSEVSTAYSW
jgi:hypothetical protein